jgi:hypothetical protein
MISDAAKEELKLSNPCDQVAARWVTLRRKGTKMIGPCPLHSPNPHARDSTAFECNADGWVCASCQDGGDVLKLVMLREQLDFPKAVEFLGGSLEPSPARAAELQALADKRQKAAADEDNAFRARERKAAYDIWHGGQHLSGTLAEDYLRARGITELPDRVPLRFAPAIAYFDGEEQNEVGRKTRRVVYRGPAMLGAIVDAEGKFRAVHITWIDPAHVGRKAFIRDPDSDDPNAGLNPKKHRGSKRGNVIRLCHMSANPQAAVIGEGIETVLSVWLAERQLDPIPVIRTMYLSACDLGNLAGKSAESVPHPALKDAAGRVRHVPGPEPDLTTTGIILPDSVQDVMLLGDGDSDRFTTHCALARAARRFERLGRAVSCAWAPDGMDFNDVLRVA